MPGTNKVAFVLGFEIEGQISTEKLQRILETAESSVLAVAFPNEDVKPAHKGVSYMSNWHIHNPDDTGERCGDCREIGVTPVLG